MPDEPIFNLKLKLEIEENIPVVSGLNWVLLRWREIF